MFSISEGCARPVRSFFKSAWNVSTHLPMRVAASFLMSSIMSLSSTASIVGDDRADVLALHHARQVAGVVQVEDLQRHAVVAAHDYGGGIHHVESVCQHLVVGQGRVTLRARILHRVR